MAMILSIRFDEQQLELLRACTIEELAALNGLLDKLEEMHGSEVSPDDTLVRGSIDLKAIIAELRRLSSEQLHAMGCVGNAFAGERETANEHRIAARSYELICIHPNLTHEEALFQARQELTGVADDASAEVEDEAGLPAKVARYRAILEKSRMKPSFGRALPAKAKHDV